MYSSDMKTPFIIQGGMGVAVSNWKLARSVSILGQLGVISGTGINSVLIRRLQDGDKDGDMRHALSAFPDRLFSEEVIKRYYLPEGRKPGQAYLYSPMPAMKPSMFFQKIMVIASFVEVFLAKEGHSGVVGLNLLEKLQLSNLPALYGAMMAGVDYVLMGAGIPTEIPGVLDCFSKNADASIRIAFTADDSLQNDSRLFFSPKEVFPSCIKSDLKRPCFFPIISSAVLASHLFKKSTGSIQGFIVESHTAGGHNALPRGTLKCDTDGEPTYGAKDSVDLHVLQKIGLPFWLAGSFSTPEKIQLAKELGASGVQVGTTFAFCQESGLSPVLKNKFLEKVKTFESYPHTKNTFTCTDLKASPTGLPFKVLSLSDTLSEESVYALRKRRCDLGYLRHVVRDKNGNMRYRCPSEPIPDYIRKGGVLEETQGRKCLCNALLSNIHLGQIQEGGLEEPPLLTGGEDLKAVKDLVLLKNGSYSAQDVITYLLKSETLGKEI